MNKLRLLILGSGFISNHLIKQACSCDFKVKLLFNNHPGTASEVYEQESLNSREPIEIITDFQPDYVICLHGNSFVPDNRILRESIETNVIIPLKLLEAVAEYSNSSKNLKKIIVVGSAIEYGRTYQEPISENFPLHPSSVYGLTKIFLYNTAFYYMEKGLPMLYIRQFNCVGPGQRASFLIPSLCRQIALIEKGMASPLIEIGDMHQERDFIDARDSSRAYLLLLQQGQAGNVYNVGSGHIRSVGQVLNEIIKLSGLKKSPPEIRVNQSLFFKEQSTSNRILADISKLTDLGFKAEIPFEKTLYDTLEYWRQNV